MWIIFGLIAGILTVVYSEVNKYYKMDGFRLNTYRSFIAVLLFIPLLSFIKWDFGFQYYLMVFIVSSLSVLTMIMQYNLAAKKNGRIANLYRPISIFITFVFWLVIDDSQRQFIANNSFNAFMIIIAFIVFIAGMQLTKRSDTNKEILLTVIQIAIFDSICIIINKLAFADGNSALGASLNFVLVANLFMFLMSFPIFLYLQQKKKLHFSKKEFTCSFYVALGHTLSWLSFCLALYYATNPAYVTVLTSLTPLWFMLYYKLMKEQDVSSPVGGFLMALGAIIVICFAS